MSTMKSPSRVIDGPYASFATADENAQIVIASAATLVLGQPLSLDVTQLGPDANVPNNGVALAQCERLVPSTSAAAGPIFGIFTGFPNGVLPRGFVQAQSSATNGGALTYTNNSGATATLAINVRQTGFGYVWAGVAATGGAAVNIGSTLVINATQAYAIAGTVVGLATVGTAIASAVFTSYPVSIAAGSRTITPVSMVGITAATPLLIDSLVSGLQEVVTPSAVTATTFTATFANAHTAGFSITGPNAPQAKGTALIANNASATGLVACMIEVQT